MPGDYKDRLAALRDEIERNGARPDVIDSIISELFEAGSEQMPADLLRSLSDAASNDAGMFSLIHAAEALEDHAYIATLIDVFPALSAQAPGWAQIVLLRVLNNAATQAELARQLVDAPSASKAALRTACERLCHEDPQFMGKAAPVLAADDG